MGHKCGVFDSWTIESETVSYKKCDKSFFDYNGSGVPADIRWFFDAEALEQNQRVEFTLTYKGVDYKACVSKEKSDSARTKILWDTDLGKELAKFKDAFDYPTAKIEKTADKKYELEMIVESTDDKKRDLMVGQETKPSHLKEMVERILNEYSVEKSNELKDNPLAIYIRNEATDIIRDAAGFSKDKYVVTGSVGQGQWAMIPWLGIFDKKVTESATKGVYIVYLLSKDGDTLYLTFNQGCTEIRNNNNSKKKTIRKMHETAVTLRDQLDSHGFAADDDMKLGDGLTDLAELYQEGVIFYKGYKKDQVPGEIELKKDLLDMAAIYNQYIDEVVEGAFYPSLEDFDPGITAKEYEKVLCDESLVKKPWLDVLVYLYRMGGIGSCKQIANQYGKGAPHYNSNAINIAKAVAKATDCPLDTRESGEKRYWPVLFFGKELPADSPDGMFLYKMREPLKEAIKAIEEKGMFQEMIEKEHVEFDKNLILYGPPGTGKTYNCAIYAVAICTEQSVEDVAALGYDEVMLQYNQLKAAGRIAFTTFHQSYGYEEFIESIKPVMKDKQSSGDIQYTIEDGLFKKFCNHAGGITSDKAESESEEPNTASENSVFIIDEINRGNISKIFGELITLIESSKRSGMPEAAAATLPYSGEEFSVPSNVYILGTMNTADRSIALMDTALRRRFQFVEMMPNLDVLKDITVDGLRVSEMLDAINKRIECLYDREHTIGHAFFMALKENPSVKCLGDIFARSVIPLLQEYFYEDYQKIQLVLGDNGKKDEDIKFIKDTKVEATSIFVGNVEDMIDLPEKRYSINPEALLKIESYKGIAPGL